VGTNISTSLVNGKNRRKVKNNKQKSWKFSNNFPEWIWWLFNHVPFRSTCEN